MARFSFAEAVFSKNAVATIRVPSPEGKLVSFAVEGISDGTPQGLDKLIRKQEEVYLTLRQSVTDDHGIQERRMDVREKGHVADAVKAYRTFVEEERAETADNGTIAMAAQSTAKTARKPKAVKEVEQPK